MQGLPVQNLLKMPKNVDSKSTKLGVQNSEEGENSLQMLTGQQDVKGSKASAKNVDFSSLLEEASNKNVKKEIDPKLVNQEVVNPNLFEVKTDKGELNTKLAKSNSSLDQLLNNLKGTNVEESGNEGEEIPVRKNFFLNREIKSNSEDSKLEKDSPLDFLVKSAKQNKVSDGNELENKKSFFLQSDKIANNIQLENGSEGKVGNKFALISGEEFADVKAKMPEKMADLNSPKDLSQAKKPVDINDIIQKDVKGQAKVQNYQVGQNILSDNIIRSSKDLAFKDTKKTKHDSIDELMSSDMKKSNQLSMIKESPLMVPVMAKDNHQMGSDLKSNEMVKVLDLSKMNTANTNQIIEKISDYVMQSQVAGKDKLDLVVKHDSLGQFQIQVNKVPNQNQIDMQIVTNNNEGHKFFVENEGALVKSLQQSGIQLSDFRIVSSMTEAGANSFGESRQFSSFSQNQNGSSEQHSNFQSFSSGDFRQGKERRNELWNEYRERYGA